MGMNCVINWVDCCVVMYVLEVFFANVWECFMNLTLQLISLVVGVLGIKWETGTKLALLIWKKMRTNGCIEH